MSQPSASDKSCSTSTSQEEDMTMAHLAEELASTRSNYASLLKKFEHLTADYENTLEDLEQERIAASKLELRLHSEHYKVENALNIQREFLDTISHELLTPLNGILGMARLLNDGPLSKETKDSIDIIQSCGESLEEKLKTLLDFIELSKGEIEFLPSIFDPIACIQALVDEYAPSIYKKNLEVTYIPSHNEYISVEADIDRIQQLLHIFLSNAIKFTHTGHILIKSRIVSRLDTLSTGHTSHELHLTIEDTGIGIHAPALKDIFRPFEQLDSSRNRNYEGIGIGLTLAKAIITQMNGAILVDSEVGKGSTFFVSIPLHSVNRSIGADPEPIVFNKEILIYTTHSHHKELLTELFQQLDIASSYEEKRSTDKQVALGETVWLIDYPATEGQRASIHELIKREAHKYLYCIALVPPGIHIPRSVKNLFKIIVPKPITLESLKQALKFAATMEEDDSSKQLNAVSVHGNTQPGSEKVLLVENNPINEKIILHLFGMLGIGVESVQSLDEMKTRVTSTTYSHLVINPHIDPTANLSLIYLILNTAQIVDNAHIVAVTGRNDTFSEEELTHAGFHTHVELPSQLEDFAEALQVNHK